MKNIHQKLRKLTALLLAVLMAAAVLPQPVQAAGVSVTPGFMEVTVGTSVQLKVKGSYKKVTWSSDNRSIATVNSKGKVTTKKKGFVRINATIILKNGKKTSGYSHIQVDSYGKLVTLKTADDATARKVHGYLTSNTPFSLIYYGNRSQSASVLKKLKTKVGKINEYGVLFQNEDAKVVNTGKNGYLYEVTKNDCQLYDYSVKFFKRLVTETINGIFNDADEDEDGYVLKPNGRLAFARKFYTWQEYQAELERLSPWIEYEDGSIGLKDNSDDLPDYYPNGCGDDDNLRKYWLLANTRFCDLSQAMKAWVIDDSLFFCGSKPNQDAGMFCMAYGDPAGISKYQSEMEQMKVMSENKAIGVCEDYARYEVTVFNQLGIKAEFDHDGGHAWSVVYPTNADGKKLKLIFDYYLYYGAESIYDRHLSPEADVY